MTEDDLKSPDKPSSWRNPWVLAWIGLIVVFFLVNAVMVFLAIDRNPGLVVENYYERGQDYEKNRLKRLARDPGWKMAILPPEFIDVAKTVPIRFSVTDGEGAPATPEKVTLFAYRPSDVRRDFSFVMEQEKPGLYRAEVNFPLKGVWDLIVAATQGGNEFTASHRISAGVVNTR